VQNKSPGRLKVPGAVPFSPMLVARRLLGSSGDPQAANTIILGLRGDKLLVKQLKGV